MGFPVCLVLWGIDYWEKFPKFGNDFQGGAAQDIWRVSGGMP
jgi:hypothetical protein